MYAMHKEEVAAIVRGKVAEMTNRQPEEPLQGDEEPIQNSGLDSVMIINLIVSVERRFDILFDDEEMLIENFSSISRITASILGKIGAEFSLER
ncbi:acyl carrier protein [Cohnella suwonensis]|uniref:Acyl carrier protein n=1 Tax=Cohnella suwonensis TaxID=696072 RepID=A0ABW0LSS7_9BACL